MEVEENLINEVVAVSRIELEGQRWCMITLTHATVIPPNVGKALKLREIVEEKQGK